MKCYYHPDLDSANACSVCSRSLCLSCSHSVKGRIFCQDCLISGAELAGLARNPHVANYSPARAALFAIIPGIGAVYNRQYPKAIAHVGVYAALWMIADAGVPIFVLATLAFWIFTIIDAYRSAQDILRRRIANPGLFEAEEDDEVKLPVWGIVLVLLGLVFLLNNLEFVNLRTFIRLAWPLLFIGAGVYLILYYFTHQTSGARKAIPRPSSAVAAPQAVTVEPPPPVPESIGKEPRAAKVEISAPDQAGSADHD